MHFPKYWALGSSGDYSCWQWSDSSPADAQAKAKESAVRLATARQNSSDRNNRYDYGQRALREPLIEELPAVNEELRSIITRNSYGALVLNTARVCFIDIDLPAEEKPKGFLSALFGGKSKNPAKPSGPLEAATDRLAAWFNRNPSWGARLYRTKAGLRVLITTHLLDPASAETEQIFGELGSDPLYCRLCKNQNSFRARLTPKPWRCNLEVPPVRWPFFDSAAEARFDAWNRKYQESAQRYAACTFLKCLGNSENHSGIEKIVDRHDALSAASSERPLA